MKKPDQIIEEWLVIKCQSGDRKAFELLIKRWNAKMLSRVYHTIKDATASKDIVQEAWIIIIKKIKTLRDPAAFPGWSLKIATLKAIDWIRKNQVDRRREIVRQDAQKEYSEDRQQQNDELLQNLKLAVHELPEEQRTIINLFYQEGLSIPIICQLTNLPAGTVKSRLFRGRESLKKVLEQKQYQDETE